MANKRTRAINREEFEKIIETIRTGFILPNGECVRPNVRIAAALILEANLGLRIGDIVRLRLADILFESGRYHLNIIEQKTEKFWSVLCKQAAAQPDPEPAHPSPAALNCPNGKIPFFPSFQAWS